jgi:hypothetical protein
LSTTPTRPSGTATGLLVAIIGAIPAGWLYLQTQQAGQPKEPTTTLAIAELPRTTVAVTVPDVPGLDPSVSRVLYSHGDTSAVGETDLSELSPEVVRVLAYYEVALAVPVPAPVDQP